MRKQNQDSAPEMELKLIPRLLALSLIQRKTNCERIALLAAARMDRHKIAELASTTAGTDTAGVAIRNKRRSMKPRGGRGHDGQFRTDTCATFSAEVIANK